jgi:hypothetical protein
MAKVTPLDVRRAQDKLKNLYPGQPGYEQALQEFKTLNDQFNQEVADVKAKDESQRASSKQAKDTATKAANQKTLEQLQPTLEAEYKKSVDLGNPDATIKAQLDKVNAQLGKSQSVVGADNTPAATATTDKIAAAKKAAMNTPATRTKAKPSSTGSSSSSSSSSTPSSTPVANGTIAGINAPSTADVNQGFLDNYGVQAALIDSDPSLQKLFKDAMDGKWDKAKFQSQFINTSWAKNHSSTWQNSQTAMTSAPGDYAQSYNRMREYLARTAVSMGETITPEQIGPEIKPNADGSYPPLKNNGSLAEWALQQSWGKGVDEAAIKQHIAQVGKINLTLPGGAAGAFMSDIKTLANDYGLNSLTTNDSRWLSENAQAFLLGKKDYNTVKQEAIEMAKNNYKPYSAQLDAGVSLRAIATPYLNTLSNLLEVPIDSIDLSSPTGYGKMVSNALMGSDPTNPAPMTLNEFETQIKQDPRWASTNNARDTVMGGVGGLLKMLGKVGA